MLQLPFCHKTSFWRGGLQAILAGRAVTQARGTGGHLKEFDTTNPQDIVGSSLPYYSHKNPLVRMGMWSLWEGGPTLLTVPGEIPKCCSLASFFWCPFWRHPNLMLKCMEIFRGISRNFRISIHFRHFWWLKWNFYQSCDFKTSCIVWIGVIFHDAFQKGGQKLQKTASEPMPHETSDTHFWAMDFDSLCVRLRLWIQILFSFSTKTSWNIFQISWGLIFGFCDFNPCRIDSPVFFLQTVF